MVMKRSLILSLGIVFDAIAILKLMQIPTLVKQDKYLPLFTTPLLLLLGLLLIQTYFLKQLPPKVLHNLTVVCSVLGILVCLSWGI